jgi:hypothetical protein
MEPQPYARKMQEELIADIEHKKPQYIVLYNIASSWNATLKSELLIVDWREEYIPKHYRKVGIVDLVQRNDTRYIFGNDVQQYVPHSHNLIFLYERNADDR